MPHGSLTPLGHRLRSVLAALSPHARHGDNARTPAFYTTNALSGSTRPRTASRTAARHFQHRATARDDEESPSTTYLPRTPTTDTFTAKDEINPTKYLPPTEEHISRKRLNKRTKVDYLTNELRRLGRDDVAPKKAAPNTRERHFDYRSRHGKRLYMENKKRHAWENIPPLEDSNVLTLPVLLARYLHRAAENQPGPLEADWMSPFRLKADERRFLESKGYAISDLRAWGTLVTEPDSAAAAEALHARVALKGVNSVPLPIFAYILRRPYISATALRGLTQHAWNLFAELERGRSGVLSPDSVFLIFIRLVRHARKTWPESLESIASYLIRYMRPIRPNNRGDSAKMSQAVTLMLNKGMHMISEPTAVAPFKNIVYQEAAVVRILAAMSEHEPPLQIDRDGYRAVIRLQIASKKTESEQHWAGLKALSWPPWKEDRTSMDSELGPEHGISKAGETLRRMMEAGYAHQPWERSALLYTGWDVDGTPTIQTRAMLPTKDVCDPDDETSLWVARIDTTRTIQEAWACYLAYQDTNVKPDEEVLLAVFEKLFKEEQRHRPKLAVPAENTQTPEAPLPKLYPGDTQEIAPLPPSTHLYTYTRTTPPTVYEFYEQLCEENVDLSHRCLSFLLSKAATPKTAFEYLKIAHAKNASVHAMLSLDPNHDLQNVPPALFNAYIGFLGRFANVLTHQISHRASVPVLFTTSKDLPAERFNAQHRIVQAVWLLQERKPRSLPPWNAALDALSHNKSYSNLHLTRIERQKPDGDHNALVAFGLTQQLLFLLRELHMELDSHGFLALCRTVENVAMAAWKILARDHKSGRIGDDNPDSQSGTTLAPAGVSDAEEIFMRQKPDHFVERYFKVLVGDEATLSPQRGSDKLALPDSAPGLPRLLTAPEPAVLHAYTRALGWCGAHDKLLAVTEWMVEHQAELAESAARNRNSASMMRRVLVSLRVFLERSWLVGSEAGDDGDVAKSPLLERLESPASREVLEEARKLVDSVEGWGGWAADEEVERYCRNSERNRRFEEVSTV